MDNRINCHVFGRRDNRWASSGCSSDPQSAGLTAGPTADEAADAGAVRFGGGDVYRGRWSDRDEIWQLQRQPGRVSDLDETGIDTAERKGGREGLRCWITIYEGPERLIALIA